jgi:hypothetical protein
MPEESSNGTLAIRAGIWNREIKAPKRRTARNNDAIWARLYEIEGRLLRCSFGGGWVEERE